VNKPKRIAFFGSDQIALPVLNSLLSQPQSLEICGILTQPDRRSGRGNKFQSNPIKQWALQSDIPVHDPQKPGVEEVCWLKELGADMVLIMAYGHILREELLKVPSYGCFNLHASLLPMYRGASPVETALAMGEQKTGVTLMQVVPRMDAGPVVDAEIIPIEESDQGATLRNKIADACVPLMARNLSSILDGSVRVQAQSESEATYCRKLAKSDGRLDFNLTARELVLRNRAFAGWPGSYFEYENTILRVGRMVEIQSDTLLCGQRNDSMEHTLVIGTKEGAIEIMELQKPGGKMLPASDFLRGFAIPQKVTFSSPDDSPALIR
jgi:methionyl-tRNA formyltransferase